MPEHSYKLSVRKVAAKQNADSADAPPIAADESLREE
jgi:hypothetical protein